MMIKALPPGGLGRGIQIGDGSGISYKSTTGSSQSWDLIQIHNVSKQRWDLIQIHNENEIHPELGSHTNPQQVPSGAGISYKSTIASKERWNLIQIYNRLQGEPESHTESHTNLQRDPRRRVGTK